MKKRVINKNKKTKPSEEFMKLMLDSSKAILRKDDLLKFENKINKKFTEQKTEILLEVENIFDRKFQIQKTEYLAGVEQIVSNIVGGTLDENVDIKNRVSVLETKVKVLENK